MSLLDNKILHMYNLLFESIAEIYDTPDMYNSNLLMYNYIASEYNKNKKARGYIADLSRIDVKIKMFGAETSNSVTRSNERLNAYAKLRTIKWEPEVNDTN